MTLLTNNCFALEFPDRIASGGVGVSNTVTIIDADLAARVGPPDVCLVNLGINYNSEALDHAQWVTNMEYICDAVRTKWPACEVYLMRIWSRTCSNCDLIDDTLIPAVVAERSFVHLGPDERVLLENGDDGVTYTVDGTHPTAAGYVREAQAWLTLLGY